MDFIDNEIKLIVCFVFAFIIVLGSIPTIIKVSKRKNLYDIPGERRSHKVVTPTLGGLAIFTGLILSWTILGSWGEVYEFQYLLAALFIVFSIGLKDDILITAPTTKLFGQIFAACIVVILGNIRITSLHGFWGITEINYYFSVFLSVFLIIVVMNGINLIDGIDGLAAGVGIVATLTYAVWFYLIDEIQYAILAVSLVGSLFAFLRFNVFCSRLKIFMGDTGSLIVGFLLAIFSIKFNQQNIGFQHQFAIHSAPAVSLGILIIPLFDTLRVIFVRLVIHKSLFKADKNHIHHRLLALGKTHLQATSILVGVNVFFIIFVFTFQELEILRLTLLLFLLAMIFSFIPNYILDKRNKKKKQEK